MKFENISVYIMLPFCVFGLELFTVDVVVAHLFVCVRELVCESLALNGKIWLFTM